MTAVILQIPRGCARFARIAPEFPEIHECYRVTGSDSYVLKVVLPSIRHLESLIDRLATHGTTITSIVLSTPLDHRLVAPGRPGHPGRPGRLGYAGCPGLTAGAPHAVPAVIPNGAGRRQPGHQVTVAPVDRPDHVLHGVGDVDVLAGDSQGADPDPGTR